MLYQNDMTISLAIPGNLNRAVGAVLGIALATAVVNQARFIKMMVGNNRVCHHQRNGKEKQQGYVPFLIQNPLFYQAKIRKGLISSAS
jgi:hypothetical protein